MDLKNILAYADKLKALNVADHYCLSQIDDSLLNITPDVFKTTILSSLDKFLNDVKITLDDNENKNLTVKNLDGLIAYNISVKENLSLIFNSGINDFIDVDRLPKGYHLQQEGIIVNPKGEFIFDEAFNKTYARSSFIPYMDAMLQVVEITHLALLDIMDTVINASAYAAVPHKATISQNNKLTAFEVALRHWFLVDANVEGYIVPKQVGEKYKDLANAKNVEMHYGNLDKKPPLRKAKLKELQNVKDSLIDCPEAKKAVENCIDALG